MIFVSSGGMLLQKLDHEDFNFDKMTKYDGAMAYSQNKRQQVCNLEKYIDNIIYSFFIVSNALGRNG